MTERKVALLFAFKKDIGELREDTSIENCYGFLRKRHAGGLAAPRSILSVPAVSRQELDISAIYSLRAKWLLLLSAPLSMAATAVVAYTPGAMV